MATSFNNRRCPSCGSTLVETWIDVEGVRYCEHCHPVHRELLKKLRGENAEARRLLKEVAGYSRSVRARPDSLIVEIRAFLGGES